MCRCPVLQRYNYLARVRMACGCGRAVKLYIHIRPFISNHTNGEKLPTVNLLQHKQIMDQPFFKFVPMTQPQSILFWFFLSIGKFCAKHIVKCTLISPGLVQLRCPQKWTGNCCGSTFYRNALPVAQHWRMGLWTAWNKTEDNCTNLKKCLQTSRCQLQVVPCMSLHP